MTTQKPSIGRIVNYSIAEGEVRPAQIVRVLDDKTVNLVVTLDGNNDTEHMVGYEADGRLQVWRGTVSEGRGFNQWHWPTKV